MSNHNHRHEPTAKLTEAELTYARFPALMTLAAIRGDAEAMADHVEHSREHMTFGQMIESMAIELAAVALTSHGSVDAADEALTAGVLKMNAGTL